MMPALHPRPWHGGSELGPGPRRKLSYAMREQYRRLLDRACGSGAITPMGERVGRRLVDLLGADGRLDPSYATLARMVGCCEKTARSAVKALIAAGLLRKVTRVVRAGWRVIQTTNAYEILLPATAAVEASALFARAARIVPSLSKSMNRGFTAGITASVEAVREAALSRLGALLGVPVAAVLPA